MDYMPEVEDLDTVCGQWYVGVPGCGKSYLARERYPHAYLKMANKWWVGYQYEEAVIMDEVELNSSDWLGHYLKIWADRYSFIAETKGGGLKIRPKHFVITSNYSIEEVFGKDRELCRAIKRRFKVTKFLAAPVAGAPGYPRDIVEE